MFYEWMHSFSGNAEVLWVNAKALKYNLSFHLIFIPSSVHFRGSEVIVGCQCVIWRSITAASYRKHWDTPVRSGQTGSDEVWKRGGVCETGPLCLLCRRQIFPVLLTIQIPMSASWPAAKCVLPPGTNGLKEKRSGRRKNCLRISLKNRSRGWWEGSTGHWWECVCVSWGSVWEWERVCYRERAVCVICYFYM